MKLSRPVRSVFLLAALGMFGGSRAAAEQAPAEVPADETPGRIVMDHATIVLADDGTPCLADPGGSILIDPHFSEGGGVLVSPTGIRGQYRVRSSSNPAPGGDFYIRPLTEDVIMAVARKSDRGALASSLAQVASVFIPAGLEPRLFRWPRFAAEGARVQGRVGRQLYLKSGQVEITLKEGFFRYEPLNASFKTGDIVNLTRSPGDSVVTVSAALPE